MFRALALLSVGLLAIVRLTPGPQRVFESQHHALGHAFLHHGSTLLKLAAQNVDVLRPVVDPKALGVVLRDHKALQVGFAIATLLMCIVLPRLALVLSLLLEALMAADLFSAGAGHYMAAGVSVGVAVLSLFGLLESSAPVAARPVTAAAAAPVAAAEPQEPVIPRREVDEIVTDLNGHVERLSKDLDRVARGKKPLGPNWRECGICCDRAVDTLLLPCGHGNCAVCAEQARECPFCRVAVDGRQKIFI